MVQPLIVERIASLMNEEYVERYGKARFTLELTGDHLRVQTPDSARGGPQPPNIPLILVDMTRIEAMDSVQW